jgi:hypothetical protein
VVDQDHDVAVALLVADLIDADPAQPGQRTADRGSATTTRATIARTVRQAIRSSCSNVDFEAG